MTHEEIKNTSDILIIAGSETTATLLSGVTYLPLRNPEAYAEVQKEVREAFESAEDFILLSTSKLSYLHACLEEALRIYPPVPLALPRRTSAEGAIIDGVVVPPNVRFFVGECIQALT
jgi:cytochrome P450